MSDEPKRRCLIVERHAWEAAAKSSRLRIPAPLARDFFPWPETQSEPISLRVFHPQTSAEPTSATARVRPAQDNGMRPIEDLPLVESAAPSFVFLEEAEETGVYNFWWQKADLPAVFAHYADRWHVGSDGQRQRLCAVVDAPVPRPILPEARETVDPPPQFLQSIRIRGYKSIASCETSLAPLTLFVGRNASGKSNLFGALAFLRDVMAVGAEQAVKIHRGALSILNRGAGDSTVSLGVDAKYISPVTGALYHAEYDFTVAIPQGRLTPVITSERLRIEDASNKIVGFDRDAEGVRWIGHEGSAAPLIEWVSADCLMLSVHSPTPYLELATGLHNIAIYSIVPDLLREPQIRYPGRVLERSGRNVASILDALKEEVPRARQRIEQYLAAIVPGVNGVEVVSAADRDFLRFHFRPERPDGTAGSTPSVFEASSMSDGTLRTLAWLIAASQPLLLQSAPSVVAIEEPETSLHPAALHALVDALDEATLYTQVLLTTHSPDILDNPTIKPENVRVVQMVDGRTVIGPIDRAGVEIIAEQLNTLGGMERENQLEVDLDLIDPLDQAPQNGQEDRP